MQIELQVKTMMTAKLSEVRLESGAGTLNIGASRCKLRPQM